MASDFDPAAYLANKRTETGGFDPAAYLRLKAKHQRNLGEIEALKANPENTLGDYIKAGASGIGDKLRGIGEGALTLGKAALSPVETVTNPSKRRELERGVDDMVTLGYGQQLADWVGKQFGDTPDQQLGATAASDAQAAPGYRNAGSLAGAILPGAGNAIGRAGGKVASTVLGKAPGAVMSAGRGALAYEAAAPAVAGLHASSEGDRLGAMREAATDPSAALLAAGAGAGTGAVAGRVNRSRGAEAVRFIEQQGRGADVGVRTPGRGGVFDAELAGTTPDDRGIGQAARIGARRIMRGLRDEHRVEVSEPYRAVKTQIDNSPAGQAPRDVAPIVANMQSAVNDLETAPSARAALQGQLQILETFRDPQTEAVMVPERQLNGLRRTLMRAAKLGQTDAPGEKEAPLRAAAFEAKRMVDEGPYAELNKFYAEGAEALTGKRRQLGLKAKAPSDANVDTKKVKLSLERHGQNTKTAGGDAEIARFAAENPSLAANVDLPELARARADLSFRLQPKHGGLVERTMGAHMGPGAALGAAVAGGGLPGLGAAAGMMGLQNATPIAGRLLYPMTRNTTGAGAVNSLVQALIEKRRREQEAAQFLMNGGRQ